MCVPVAVSGSVGDGSPADAVAAGRRRRPEDSAQLAVAERQLAACPLRSESLPQHAEVADVREQSGVGVRHLVARDGDYATEGKGGGGGGGGVSKHRRRAAKRGERARP